MSEKTERADVVIPPEGALVFQPPEEGVTGWTMRNTAHGLLIEETPSLPGSPSRPILRLTPESVVVRGDLMIDGAMRRELDCHKFEGRWAVYLDSGNSGRVGEKARIRRLEGNKFGLYNDKTNELVQYLYYNPRTATLDDDPDDPEVLDRSISFWDCKTRGGDRNRIFAMRRQKPGARPDPANCLPWELDEEGNVLVNDSGTWGAEEVGDP